MTAGTAVNLVSRCSSVDEFVAAFRTYVHRDHMFVPTSGLVPAGTKGRVAITLADGTPVLAGEAEVLSSSAVPQGPYQKPGLRLRFVDLDESARPVLARLERARTEPGMQLADAIGAPTTGARTDIRAAEGTKTDPTEAAMCTIVETATPNPVASSAGLPPRVDLTPKPARPPQAAVTSTLSEAAKPPSRRVPGLGGGVPGKSFKIPSIPSPPRPSGPAVPLAEASGPLSGDFTVPTDPQFQDGSIPFPVATTPPPPPAVPPPSAAGGKSRNRTMLGNVRGKTPATESAPNVADDGATTRMPELLQLDSGPIAVSETAPAPQPIAEAVTKPASDPTPEPVADAAPMTGAPPPPPPPSVGLGAPSGGRTFAKTLLGVPAITLTPAPAPTPAPEAKGPLLPSLSEDDGWSAPEEGALGDRTEQSIAPAPEGGEDIDVDMSTDLDGAALPQDVVMVLPSEPPPNEPLPPTPPPTPAGPVLPKWEPLGKGQTALRAGPSAPTIRTPQSMLELGQAKQTPLPGMTALPGMPPPSPPPTPAAPPQQPLTLSEVAEPPSRRASVSARDAEPTQLVFDHEGTDEVALGRRNRRPLVIGVFAGVVLLGVVLGLVIAGGSGGKKRAEKAGPKESSVPAPRADAAPAPAAAPDAAPTTPEPVAVDAAVAAVPDEPPDEPPPVEQPAPPKAGGCSVAFTSTPPGAAVSVGGKKVGTTPVTVDLPCKKASATFSRQRYQNEVKAFTPKKGTTKVAAKLERPTFTIKVTSSPTGATVVVGGKTVGKTPVTAKVLGYQAVTVKVSKPGFATKVTKVTAKKNNTSVKVSLRRGN